MPSWLKGFRAHFSMAEFFARFIDKFDSARNRNYTCPFHRDVDPSMSVDPNEGVFYCHGCGAHGGLLDFFARLRGHDLAKPEEYQRCVEDLFREFDLDPESAASCSEIDDAPAGMTDAQVLAALRAARARPPEAAKSATADREPIAEATVAAMVDALWSSCGEQARRFLIEERGLSEVTLRKFDVGWCAERSRIAFPVRDDEGRVTNVRFYSPASADKMKSYAEGYGKPFIYPLVALAGAVAVVLAEGEIDALTLIQLGFPAVTATGGAKIDWRKNRHLAVPFRGKAVTILYDRGAWEPGAAAAREIAPVLLEAGAVCVKIAEWSDEALLACGGEKCDANDYYMKAKAGHTEFQALLDGARMFGPDPSDAASGSADAGQQATAAPQEPQTALALIGGKPTMDGDEPQGAASDSAPANEQHPESLWEQLWRCYFTAKKAGVVRRVGVPIAIKATIVVDHLAGLGARFFYYRSTDEVIFVLAGRRHLVSSGDPAFKGFWHSEVKLFGLDTAVGRELLEGIAAHIQLRDDCSTASRSNWGHFNWVEETIYLCLDPAQASIVRVRAGHDGMPIVEVVPNGTDNVLLRCPTFRERAFTYEPGGLKEGISLFRDLIHQRQSLDETDRLASSAFNLAALTPGLLLRPLRFNQGEPGAGKTTPMQYFEAMLYGGATASGYKKAEALWAALDAGGPLITQDNAESIVRRRFEDTYNRATTGGDQKERKLYSNGVVITYHANGSLCLTAVESFTKQEDIERAIEFRFDLALQNKSDRILPSAHLKQIEERGDAILSGILEALSIGILPGFRKNLEAAQRFIATERPTHSKMRFNESLALMLLWFEALGDVLWDAERAGAAFDAGAQFLAFIDRQSEIHNDNAVASSREVQFLDAIRLDMGRSSAFDRADMPGLPVDRKAAGACTIGPATTGVLFAAFSMIAKSTGTVVPWEGPRQLGQRMSAAAKAGTLAKAGWTREEHGTVHGNNPMFRFLYTAALHSVPQDNPEKGNKTTDAPNSTAEPKAGPGRINVNDKGEISDAEIGDALSEPGIRGGKV